MLFLVDDDRLHLGRGHRVDDELGGIVAPQHDVDALAVEFVGHRLHARSAHADAGADGIGARVGREHRDLRAVARIARAGADLHQPLPHFGNFEFEQLHHEFGRSARHEQLRAAHFRADVVQVAAYAIAGAHNFAGNALVTRDHCLGVAAQVDVDVAAFHALDHAGEQFADAVTEGVDDLGALGLTHPLHDHLLGCLGGDAAELRVLDLLLDELANLDTRLFVHGIHQADHALR